VATDDVVTEETDVEAILPGQRHEHAYWPEFADPCSLSVTVETFDERALADGLELYVTLDGRPPSREDYDRRAVGFEDRKRVTVAGDQLVVPARVGIAVRAERSETYRQRVRELAEPTWPDLRAAIRERTAREALSIYRGDEYFDCADLYMTSTVRAAESVGVDLGFRVFDARSLGWKRYERDDHDSASAFAARLRRDLGAINLVDNTVSRPWADLGPGDVMLFESPEAEGYTGHTMVIVEREDGGWWTVEGQMGSPIGHNWYTEAQFRRLGPVEGRGRRWNWELLRG
jgi:hypothetical protein